jgi:hypothetical protein
LGKPAKLFLRKQVNAITGVFSALEAFNILTRTSKAFLRTDFALNLLEALARFSMVCFRLNFGDATGGS